MGMVCRGLRIDGTHTKKRPPPPTLSLPFLPPSNSFTSCCFLLCVVLHHHGLSPHGSAPLGKQLLLEEVVIGQKKRFLPSRNKGSEANKTHVG